ncbi:MAG TPA: dihydrolipoamide acetyltransferase family protein [Anaerolineales bacterium]|nr:dihydrolipoamide acetyltransferase family protein [Anaerolineales bacterium]
MPTQVLMPELGESVEEVTVTRWLKHEGDKINEFDPLLEVNTDKVDTEIPSPASGVVLKILVSENTTVNKGQLLAWIGQPGETLAADKPSSPAPAAPVSAPASSPLSSARPGRDPNLGFISPVVARMASEHHLDLTQIPGTGQGGRITKRDVEAYLSTTTSIAAPVAPPAPTPAPAPVAPEPVQPRTPPPAVAQPLPGELLPLTNIRRAIADHMVMSKRTSPHVTTVMEADMSAVTAHRAAHKAAFARDGVNLTFTPYLIAAMVAASKAYPIANSSWSDAGIVLHRDINVGMATALEQDGLIVPVIKNADSLSLLGLSRLVNDLSNRARLRQLKPDEVKGGTITLTNHGTSGSLFATPIINQPQCAILGAGMIQKRVVVISDGLSDAIAIRPMVYLSLTFDHRILDGATADYFLGTVKKTLETWK